MLAFLRTLDRVTGSGGGGGDAGGVRWGALVLDDCYNRLTASALLADLFSGHTTLQDTVTGQVSNNNNNYNSDDDDGNDDSNHIERCNLRFLQSPHCAANCLQHNHLQITCDTSTAYYVQYASCHLVQRDSLAIKVERVETAFIL